MLSGILDDWPIIRKLHVPASTKSFLLKLFMNALPTANSMKFAEGEVRCPACKEELTGDHFFSKVGCLKKYTKKIYEWCDKHWLPRPACKIDFDNRFSLILMNCLWKTFCKARFNSDLNTCALQNTAKDFFKRELQLAQILYEKDYKTQLKLYKFDWNSIHFKYEVVNSIDNQ